jgi:hypothetical protein
MQFQYAQPSQVSLPTSVIAILNQGTIVCICFDQQSASEILGYNSAFTSAPGLLVD